MKRMRTRHSWRRHALAAGAALILLSTAGCTASTVEDDSALNEEIAASSPAQPAPELVTEKMTCAGFGDVMTMVFNVRAAVSAGRMEESEKVLWFNLATRVQDRVQSGNEGPVAEALAALKQAAPAVPAGYSGESGIYTDAWRAAAEDIRVACQTAGSEIMMEGFVGG